MMKKGISVVICSYNSENRIKRVLDCLLAQENCDGIAWEVLMVDNASTDNVVEVAGKHWNHPKVPLHIFHEPRQGQSYATQTGFEKATYGIVVMVDDDNYVSSEYISRAYKIMEEHPDVGIAGGKGTGLFDEEPPEWFKSVEQGFAIGPQTEKEGYLDTSKRGYLYGAGSIIRKPVYDYLQQSDFQLMLKGRIGKSLVAGEDQERCKAFLLLGYKLWYDPKLEFIHHMPAKRINWNYTRKLFHSFGRASIYHNLYNEILKKKKGVKGYVRHHMILDILNEFRKFLFTTITYLALRIKGHTEGRQEIIMFDYTYGRIMEKIFNFSRIRQCRRQLRNAAWRKQYTHANVPEN
jgi:glycosyltransferase involved in cell wall biosynthesis